MFIQSEKDIDSQKPQQQKNLTLRALRPKLISSLNYEQEYLLRRKQKRNNRRRSNQKTNSQALHSQTIIDKSNPIYSTSLDEPEEIQNNFYKEVYDGNDKICGYWLNGLLEGQTEIEYQNGDYFKGKFEKGYKTEGLMVFKDQGSYEGTFYNEQFHGKGVLRLKDKSISADWINGIVQSNCVVQYKNSNLYYGPLRDFKKHGYGYLYFPNDTKFFGQFVDGMVKGYGEFYEKGKLKYKGLWKNGKLIQEKRQQDWSYNFQDENINWELIEELFEKKNAGILNCFQIFNTKAFNNQKNDQEFKEMLESSKRKCKGKARSSFQTTEKSTQNRESCDYEAQSNESSRFQIP